MPVTAQTSAFSTPISELCRDDVPGGGRGAAARRGEDAPDQAFLDLSAPADSGSAATGDLFEAASGREV
jgi:hypothetical protein